MSYLEKLYKILEDDPEGCEVVPMYEADPLDFRVSLMKKDCWEIMEDDMKEKKIKDGPICPICGGTDGYWQLSGAWTCRNGEAHPDTPQGDHTIFKNIKHWDYVDPNTIANEIKENWFRAGWVPENDVVTDPPFDDSKKHSKVDDRFRNLINFIEDNKLSYCLGNAVECISRSTNKDLNLTLLDLRKAIGYIEHEIERVKKTTKDTLMADGVPYLTLKMEGDYSAL